MATLDRRGIMDAGTLLTAASVIGAFGTAALVFRLERELHMAERGEPRWIPWADWLMIVATVMSFLIVTALLLFPTAALHVASGCLAGAAMMAAGYPFAIFAHYRLLFGGKRQGPRTNPEGAECLLVLLSIVLATIAAVCTFVVSGGGLTWR